MKWGEYKIIQISYTVFINGDRYALIGMTGSNHMSSGQFGSKPTALSVTSYHEDSDVICELTPVGLYLRGLKPNEENGYHEPIREINPAKNIHQTLCHDEDVLIPFSGRIRLAKDFINQPRVNVAYQKALAFKTVFDITLKEGHVVEIRDRSWEMEKKREAIENCYRFPDKLERVLDAFSLDLDLE